MEEPFRKDLTHLTWAEVYARQEKRAHLMDGWIPPAVPQPDKGHLPEFMVVIAQGSAQTDAGSCPRGVPRSKVLTYHRQYGEVARVTVSPDKVKETA
jgi:hypothetical protein